MRKKSACCLFVYDSPRTGSASDRNVSSQVRKLGNIKAVLFTRSRFYFYHSFYHQPDGALCGSDFNRFFTHIIFPLLLGMSIESVPADMRATSMGAYQALYALGIFRGPLVEGFFNDWLGLRAGFYFAAVLGLAADILAQLICEEPMRKNRRSITRHDFIFVYAFKKEEILFG